MSDVHPTTKYHGPVSRRRFLRVAGASVAGSSILSMIDARQAPAQIKGSNLRILTWSHFIPAYDTWFDKMAKDCSGTLLFGCKRSKRTPAVSQGRIE